ncbi:hypothetical protein HY991_05585 [Candidatus Micrarchaeota archaeon]|nr:hypothetical protein [Candidatus Micrarchaeota archaeon]
MKWIFLAWVGMLLSLVSALGISPSYSEVGTCICDTASVPFTVLNEGTASETFSFFLSGPANFGAVAPQISTLSGGQQQALYVFLTPDCFASPGKYLFTLTGSSQTQKSSAAINLTVTPCISLYPELAPPYSMCYGEKKEYTLVLQSRSRTADREYTILLSGNASSGAYTKRKVNVSSGSRAFVPLVINSTSLGIGKYFLSFKAASVYELTKQETKDSAQINLNYEIRNCQRVLLELPSAEIQACSEKPSSIQLKISNNGFSEEVLDLKANSSIVSFSKKRVVLLPGKSETVETTISANPGRHVVKMSAESPLSKAEEMLVVNSRACYGSSLTTEGEKSFCSGQEGTLLITLKNTGKEDTFSISHQPSAGILSDSRVSLDEGESKKITFRLLSNLGAGQRNIMFTASSPNSQASANFTVSIENCYGVKLTGTGGRMCPCTEANLPIEVINLGTKNDSFIVTKTIGPEWLKLTETKVSVPAGYKAAVNAHIYVCDADAKDYGFEFSAASETNPAISDKLCINISVLSKGVCYGSAMSAPNETTILECSSNILAVSVQNTGQVDNTFSFSIEGVKWASVTPSFVSLQRLQAKTVFLALNPPINSIGRYTLTLKSTSKDTETKKDIVVIVKGRPNATTTTTPAEAKKLAPINATISYENSSLVIESVPGAWVMLITPKKETLLSKTNASGVLVLPTKEYGEWKISISGVGLMPLNLTYNLTQPIPVTGLVVAGPQTLPFVAVVVIAIILILYIIYELMKPPQIEERKEEMEETEEKKPRRRRARAG